MSNKKTKFTMSARLPLRRHADSQARRREREQGEQSGSASCEPKRAYKISFFLTAAAVILITLFPQTAFAKEKSSLNALDTVAGFETKIEARGVAPFVKVVFSVEKPNRSLYTLDASADEDGTAEVILPEDQTRSAGVYKVTIKEYALQNIFEVFPGEMNPATSKMHFDNDKVLVKISDDFGNPLAFHEVKIQTKRPQDRVDEINKYTDSQGRAVFRFMSAAPGVAVLTAVDESAGKALNQSLEIMPPMGGDNEPVLLAQAGTAGNVARLEIENLPASVLASETVSLTVRAVTTAGQTLPTYAGTVVFTSSDGNATLPSPYTFAPADQGRKTFNLGVTFRTPGSQRITVVQQGNEVIRGDKQITVVISATSTQSSDVRITKPAAGTYSVNTLEVAGEAAPNTAVKIFDNGQQSAEVQTNSSGRFTYRTSLLRDGGHIFSAQSGGRQSQSVTVNIDSTPAQIEQVDILKSVLAPGESTEITIRSDTNLSSVKATVGEFITDLVPDSVTPGLYRGTLTAPTQDGMYTINVILTDALGNSSPAAEVGTIRVDSGLSSSNVTSFSVPSKVQSVRADVGNGEVHLSWQEAYAESGIAFYRIFYGTDPRRLSVVLNTRGPVSEWVIPNLINGTTYYFQMVGVDTQGSEGDSRSDLVTAAPSATASGAYDDYSPGLCDQPPCSPDAEYPPYTPEDGPEVIGLVMAALLSGAAAKFLRKKPVL